MPGVLLIGLDGLGPARPGRSARSLLPALTALAEQGVSGPLHSTHPPSPVPAWTTMLTGRDPGELGVYGAVRRRSRAYLDLAPAGPDTVRHPRVWDRLTAAGRPSVVVGMPQTSPPPAIDGVLVPGFEDRTGATFPPRLADEISALVGDYLTDVPDFRALPPHRLISAAWRMTERRFSTMEHLMRTRPWDLAAVHEIGLDRVQHGTWTIDELLDGTAPAGPSRRAAVAYCRFVDACVGRLVRAAGPGTSVMIASGHGTVRMRGALLLNEILRDAGLLVLRTPPAGAQPLTADLVDWSRTAAWADGGHQGSIFLNLAGREPRGTVAPAERPALIARLRALFGSVDAGAQRVSCRLESPRELYRAVRGLPPDLVVRCDDESWRAYGSVGVGVSWLACPDDEPVEVNHTAEGFMVLRVPDRAPGRLGAASALDVAPTLLELAGLPPDPALPGRSLAPGARIRA